MLQNAETADIEITDEFIEKFAVVLGSRWPLLASLLSFTTDEIWQITTTVHGVPSVKAAAMMKRWRDNASATFGILTDKVHKTCMVTCSILLVYSKDATTVYKPHVPRQCLSSQRPSIYPMVHEACYIGNCGFFLNLGNY